MLLLVALFATNTLYSAQRLSRALDQVSAIQTSLSALPDSFREVHREAEVLQGVFQRWDRLGEDQKARLIPLRFAALNARLSESLIRLEALNYPLSIKSLQQHGRSLLATYVQLESEFSSDAQESRTELNKPERWSVWLESVNSLERRLAELERIEAQRQASTEREAFYSALTFTILTLALSLIFVIYLSRLLEPIRALTEGVIAFGDGRYDHRVSPRGAEELSQLAVALNQMGAAIELRDKQLSLEQQQRLEKASLAAAGHLSAQITHELRNPLSSIGLNSELLAEEIVELGLPSEKESGLTQLLRDISREIERLKAITEEYLRYARIPPPDPAHIELNTLCADIIEFSRAEAERSRVTLILDPDPISRSISVDPNQLRSALINLIKNSCESLETSGGYVKVTVRSGGGEVHITVSDNGPGISSDLRSRVFEPFFSTKAQGTGLGLSMVRQLIEKQGGRVELSPSSPDLDQGREGRGTSFMISLPLHAQHAPNQEFELR